MNRRQQKKLSKRLVEAATFGDTTQINALLRTGACPEAGNTEGTTPLYAASVNGAADNVLCLLAAGALPNTESGRGTEGTPLCAAACWGHTETVRALLTHGADPNLHEDHGMGRSPLQWAMTGPYPETIAVLLAAGARPHDPAT
ncbi:ankyrin repeat domain-containing protein [Streptomyces sp. NBC_01221]|uniref:ankyrin repeat domain-containing protein n=1 Tax=unclassified Streptomyces TaxID=2593676 RepID=UPI00225333E2|nr:MULTISPECIES: ankyrin repeat domain-containing protein [unclassified Streptomyces]MCX4787121.1 ankyrin repeat domain-containing protein [Streptomyces sp. NBC_01221]MCX4797098.1 ankyrin repeat domain-containing protein [Streptomyces sp. NBC_01242]WSP55439.1 ankyrin repeat domain-containing protein [Streptomyces sp. NBC_01241]